MGMRESYKASASYKPRKLVRFGNWIAGGFRIVTGMEAPPTDLPDGRADLVSRRRLLQLAGAASLAATVSACSTTGVESAAGAHAPPGSLINYYGPTRSHPDSKPALPDRGLAGTRVECPVWCPVVPGCLGRPSCPLGWSAPDHYPHDAPPRGRGARR